MLRCCGRAIALSGSCRGRGRRAHGPTMQCRSTDRHRPTARTHARTAVGHSPLAVIRLSCLSAQEGPAEEPSALKCVTLLQVGTHPRGHGVRHTAAAACERLLNPLMQTHCDLYACNVPCAGRTAVAGAARVRCQQSMGAPVRQHHCRHGTAHSAGRVDCSQISAQPDTRFTRVVWRTGGAAAAALHVVSLLSTGAVRSAQQGSLECA